MPQPRRTGRRSGRNARVNRANIRRSFSGRVLRVSPRPPAFNACPWYPLTVAVQQKFTTAAAQCFTVNNLLQAFQAQTGVKVLPQLCVRIQSLMAWETTGSTLNIACDVIPDGTSCASYSDSVGSIISYPGKVSYACGGYRWPYTSRQQTKTAAEGTTVIFRTLSPTAGSKVHIQINILWSFGSETVANPSQFDVVRPLTSLSEFDPQADYDFVMKASV